MKNIFLKILKKIKEKVDKLYYFYYTKDNEMLIRQTFPGVHLVDSYSTLEYYTNSRTYNEIENISKLIMSYYWGEVSLAISQKNYTQIEKLQSVLDLANNLILFKERLVAQ